MGSVTWDTIQAVTGGVSLFVFIVVWIYGTKWSYDKLKRQKDFREENMSAGKGKDSALEALRTKYAEGEISEEEFEKKKENLTK